MEFKRPGDKDWILGKDPRSIDVQRWQCKDLENAQEDLP
jgi:hypothetical protein